MYLQILEIIIIVISTFITLSIINTVIEMTTISIKEDTRKGLLRIAGEIQKRTHERVDFDSVIQFLIELYDKNQFDSKAWRQFTKPIPGVDFDIVYKDLIMERKTDDK
jgi:23S rRNA-/tRNA-specific pseudouridylate synthase